MVNCYWYIGKYIYEAQGNKDRADYGTYLIKYLSERLIKEFGGGFSNRSLWDIVRFYETFSIMHTVCAQSKKSSLSTKKSDNRLKDCPEVLKKLSWSHLRLIMRLYTPEKREFYIKECIECNWSTRQLERQMNTSYYEKLLSTQQKCKDNVRNEINITEPNLISKTNPLIILLNREKIYLEDNKQE